MASTFTVEDKTIKDVDALNYFKAIWRQAEDYWTKTIEQEWRKNDQLYHDIYKWPEDKMDWQADIRTPIADNLVTRMSNFFTRILVSTDEDYFTVDHDDTAKKEGYQDIVKAVLRDNRFPLDVFHLSLSRGLMYSIYVNKVCYVSEERRVPAYESASKTYYMDKRYESKTKVIAVDPHNIRLDPSGLDRYIIEIMPDIPLNEFESMARANEWTNVDVVKRSVYDRAKKVGESNHLPVVTLKYGYTKALTNADGKVLLEDVYVIVADDDYVVYVGKNILPDGVFPYVYENPIQSLGGPYGRSYIAKNRSIMLNYIESINLLMDAFRISAMGVYEYDTTMVSSDAAHIFTKGLRPGAFYPKQGSSQILRGVFNNSLQNSAALQVVFFLDRELQNRSFQNEFFMGQPTAKGRPTFGEVNMKSQESTAFFTDIANYIEEKVIQKILWLVLVTELIYMEDPEKIPVVDNISDETTRARIQGMSFTERMKDVEDMTLEVRGISGKIRRLGSFNRFIQIFSVLGNIPGILPALRANQLLSKAFDLIDDTPDELFDLNMLEQAEQIGDQALIQQMMGGAPTQ